MLPCNGDDDIEDVWHYTADQQLKHKQTGLCIDRKNLDKNFIHAAVCNSQSKTQHWEFQKSDRH